MIGDLSRRVTLQERSESVDSFGQRSQSWSDVATVWASIVPLAGRELLAANAISAEATHRITIRYRAGLDASMRAVYSGRAMNIVAVQDRDTAHRYIDLLVSEGLSNG